MIWKTKITEIAEIKYPILMGSFAGIGRAEFAAAVSNAGGLGIIAALNFRNPRKFEEELEKMNELTDNPYGINFTLAPPELLKKNPKAPTQEHYFEYVDIAREFGVKIFTTSAYKAERLGEKIHNKGGYWLHKCVTIPHALSSEKEGADGVTLVGVEGTGFKNPRQHSSLINITVARKKLNIPIIAAGGFGDARGFLAALAMGADAVCLGTALMATKECPSNSVVKRRLINQDIYDQEYYKQIYHHELKDKSIWSPAAAHRDEVVPMNEFFERVTNEAEAILRGWGFTGNTFSTL